MICNTDFFIKYECVFVYICVLSHKLKKHFIHIKKIMFSYIIPLSDMYKYI